MLQCLKAVGDVGVIEYTGKPGRPKITKQLEKCIPDISKLFEAATATGIIQTYVYTPNRIEAN